MVVGIIGAAVSAFAMLAVDVLLQQWLLDNLVNSYAGNADFGMVVLFCGILVAGLIAMVFAIIVAKYVAEVRESSGKMWGLSVLAFSLNLVAWMLASYLLAGNVEGYAVPLARAMTYLVLVFPGGINLYWACIAVTQMVFFAAFLVLFGVQVKLPTTGKRVGYATIKHKKTKKRKRSRK